jgi:hypothetical protein
MLHGSQLHQSIATLFSGAGTQSLLLLLDSSLQRRELIVALSQRFRARAQSQGN